MRASKKLPLIAICGRPNVGKSTLFNRITGRQSAIIHSEIGVTRDRAYGSGEWHGRSFRIVDTGGIVDNPADPITHMIQEQVRAALDDAQVIIFVVDGQQEITRGDIEIRDELFRYSKPVVLAVNKLDNAKLEQNRTDFYELGLGDPMAISSGHGIGIDDLMIAVTGHLPATVDAKDEDGSAITKVAIVGKPNVGKSSFLNAILNEERSIVHDVPGTTRDAIDVDFVWKDKEYLLIDTAGLRKKAGIKREVERFSIARSLRAVRRADVCLVLIDATEGITEQDKRIVNYIAEHGAGMILVWTKWDLIEDKELKFKSIAAEIELKAPFLKYVPYLTISNVTRQRLFTVFDFIDRVKAEVEKRVSTPELNSFMESLRAEVAPSMHKKRQARIKYATQVSVKPTTFVLFVNQKSLFHFSYLRFIENRLREKFGFDGVPLKIELRQSKRAAAE